MSLTSARRKLSLFVKTLIFAKLVCNSIMNAIFWHYAVTPERISDPYTKDVDTTSPDRGNKKARHAERTTPESW